MPDITFLLIGPVIVLAVILILYFTRPMPHEKTMLAVPPVPLRQAAARASMADEHPEPPRPTHLLEGWPRMDVCHNPMILRPESPRRPPRRRKKKPPLSATQLRSPKRRKLNARRRQGKRYRR